MRRTVGAICMIVALAGPASAVDWHSLDREVTADLAYMRGVADGITLANAAAEMDFNTPLYCAPPKLAMNTTQYFDLIEGFLAENAGFSVTETATVLLFALRDVFPC